MMMLFSAFHRFAGRYFDVRRTITVMLYYWEIDINDGTKHINHNCYKHPTVMYL